MLRSITGASTGLAAIAVVSGIITGFSTPKDGDDAAARQEAANRINVMATLLGATAGGILGVAYKVNAPSAAQAKGSSNVIAKSETAAETWKDWREFAVAKKIPESSEITSFYLKPVQPFSLPNYRPGQFLTIKLDIPDHGTVIRTYSLSDYTSSGEYYRLSIKKEGPPKGQDVPPGVASTFMHEQIQEGSVIQCKPPNGNFFLDIRLDLPAVLLSNGVGITPMLAMAKAAPNRPVWFVHGARNGKFHAFRDEMKQLGDIQPNLSVIYRYSRPNPEDEGLFHSVGYADIEFIQAVIAPEIEKATGSTDAEYFMCGSPPFMEGLQTGLKEWGVPEERIYFEAFGAGKPKGVKKSAGESDVSASVDQAEVTFAQSEQTLTWTQADGTLLEFAEANGIDAPFSCRQGVCLTCMCDLEAGEVLYDEEPAGTPDEGAVLICVAKPKSDRVILDL
ncbi:MAG: 2Fe-2S iron-sulfur cluster-binding protein [Cyanobacteria bacterium P01_H01_bin.15]